MNKQLINQFKPENFEYCDDPRYHPDQAHILPCQECTRVCDPMNRHMAYTVKHDPPSYTYTINEDGTRCNIFFKGTRYATLSNVPESDVIDTVAKLNASGCEPLPSLDLDPHEDLIDAIAQGQTISRSRVILETLSQKCLEMENELSDIYQIDDDEGVLEEIKVHVEALTALIQEAL